MKRRTVDSIEELQAYKQAEREQIRDWQQRGKLRVNLNTEVLALLEYLSKQEDVEESTWFQLLAARFDKDPAFEAEVQKFANSVEYADLPQSSGLIYKLYTMPMPLKTILEKIAARSRFHSSRGGLSPFLRCALMYIALKELGWSFERVKSLRSAE